MHPVVRWAGVGLIVFAWLVVLLAHGHLFFAPFSAGLKGVAWGLVFLMNIHYVFQWWLRRRIEREERKWRVNIHDSHRR